MKRTVNSVNMTNMGQTAALCPHCGKQGTFDVVGQDVNLGNDISCGQRRCPNPDCIGHLFVVFVKNQLVEAYPPVRVDFDITNVPEKVKKTFNEALDCHATNCHIAAAIMVRRTLEEICHERGAKGANLKERIKDLESKIILPKELIEGMNELRLLGNDAAHIESQTFESITAQELEVAFEFTKEIIKGLYQYSVLLTKLRDLKSKTS